MTASTPTTAQTFTEHCKHLLPSDSNTPAWLTQRREQGLSQFQQQGLPSSPLETWKYTRTDSLLHTGYQPIVRETTPQEQIETVLENYLLLGQQAYRAVFIDGLLAHPLSHLPSADIFSQRQAWQQKQADDVDPNNGVDALNLAMAEDGLLLELDENTHLEKPLHCLFINTQTQKTMQHYRHRIGMAAHSSAEVILHYIDLDGCSSFCSHVMQGHLAESASLTLTVIQQCQQASQLLTQQDFQLATRAALNIFQYDWGGQLVRHDWVIDFNEPQAHAELKGFYYSHKRQHIDTQIAINHAVPQCTSNVYYKGIADDRSRAVFNARAIVHPHAQQTQAHQKNHNLLLSNRAEIDTKPQLEIFADDVQCAHGATVGQLDEHAIFYLQARGITKQQAIAMLLQGFANEVIHPLKIESLQAYVQNALQMKFAASQEGS